MTDNRRVRGGDPEDEGKREDGLRTLDGSEDIRLGRALGESSAGKAEIRDADQNQQESDHTMFFESLEPGQPVRV